MTTPAFEVKDLASRHYKIYADGRVEGFVGVDPQVVVNRIPALILAAEEAAYAAGFAAGQLE